MSDDDNPRPKKKRKKEENRDGDDGGHRATDDEVPSAVVDVPGGMIPASSSAPSASSNRSTVRQEYVNPFASYRAERRRQSREEKKLRNELALRHASLQAHHGRQRSADPDSKHVRQFRLALLGVILGNVSDRWKWKERGERRRFTKKSGQKYVLPRIQTSSDKEKNEMFQWYGTKDRRGYHLKEDLQWVPVAVLKRLYNTFCSDVSFKFGKGVLMTELMEYYYRGQLPTVQRAEEREVLAELDTENLYFTLRSTTEGGETVEHTLSKDVMAEIVSFLQHDRWLVSGVGLVCWDWYTLVLTTWRKVVVAKKNLQSVPLTILRSVRRLVLRESDYDAKSRFTAKEVAYILENVVAKRLVEITFRGQSVIGFPRLVKPLAKFNKGSRRTPGPHLGSIRRLVFEEGSFVGGFSVVRAKPKQMDAYLKVRLCEVTPNVTTITRVPALMWLNGLAQLRVLRMQLLYDVEEASFSELSLPKLIHLAMCLKAGQGQWAKPYRGVVPWVVKMLKGQLQKLELQSMPPKFWDDFAESLAGTVLPKLDAILLHTSWWKVHQGAKELTASFPNARVLVVKGLSLRSSFSAALSALGSVKRLVITTRDMTKSLLFSSSVADILVAKIPKVFLGLHQSKMRPAEMSYSSGLSQNVVVEMDAISIGSQLEGYVPSLIKAALVSPHILSAYNSVVISPESDEVFRRMGELFAPEDVVRQDRRLLMGDLDSSLVAVEPKWSKLLDPSPSTGYSRYQVERTFKFCL